MENQIELQWLNKKGRNIGGSTWGVPWREGTLQRGEVIYLADEKGEQVPVQSWPTAFWPDGSIKWTAHAAVFENPDRGRYFIGKETGISPSVSLRVEEKEDFIQVHTGRITCRMNRKGTSLIRWMARGEKKVCSDGRLVCILEKRKESGGKAYAYEEETFESEITSAVVEQKGELRSVVRFEGIHRSGTGERSWLPFTLRFYFYAGTDSIRMVHTFVFDGEAQKDFIKGIGMQFAAPVSGALYNRHVQIAGDTGFFNEAARLLTMRRNYRNGEFYKLQLSGEKVEIDPVEHAQYLKTVEDLAVWDSFKVVQDSSDHYRIQKRTKQECSWIDAFHGKRSGGLVFVGSENGGVSVGVKNFWQKYPSSLEVENLSREEACIKAWFWSPDAQAMDLRHYDTETHVDSAYEGFHELRSTPHGIANTNEITLRCFDGIPEQEVLWDEVERLKSPALLVCRPEYYHAAKVFGVWSLPDRGTEVKALMEDHLDDFLLFYKEEIEQRRWYGFWNYGDVMHTYDPDRHAWRYDLGGYAWDNCELVPNMWLWLSFLRTGREDIFRLAEALTRHASEVDTYHLGEYAGLGSRHNVVHWGCGCKEARISMAGLHRYYYYLTADERIGDIMDEVKDTDYATAVLDPMRDYFPKDQYAAHIRSGPDWSAFCSNWMTRWERFEDTFYRDKLMKGVESLKKMPFGLCSGPTFGYYPEDGVLHFISEDNYAYHMVISFGAPEVWMELGDIMQDAKWKEMLAQFGEFYAMEEEELLQRTAGAIGKSNWHWPMFATRMVAYAAAHKKDKKLADEAWKVLLGDNPDLRQGQRLQVNRTEGLEYTAKVREIPWVSTNWVAQWCLNTIECMELIGEELPESVLALKKEKEEK